MWAFIFIFQVRIPRCFLLHRVLACTWLSWVAYFIHASERITYVWNKTHNRIDFFSIDAVSTARLGQTSNSPRIFVASSGGRNNVTGVPILSLSAFGETSSRFRFLYLTSPKCCIIAGLPLSISRSMVLVRKRLLTFLFAVAASTGYGYTDLSVVNRVISPDGFNRSWT